MTTKRKIKTKKNKLPLQGRRESVLQRPNLPPLRNGNAPDFFNNSE